MYNLYISLVLRNSSDASEHLLIFFLEVWEHKTGAGRVRKCHAYPELKDRAGGGSMRGKHTAKNCHGVKGVGLERFPKALDGKILRG